MPRSCNACRITLLLIAASVLLYLMSQIHTSSLELTDVARTLKLCTQNKKAKQETINTDFGLF